MAIVIILQTYSVNSCFQESLGGALFACRIWREFAKLSREELVREQLRSSADEFEDLAIDLVTQCYRRRPQEATDTEDASYNVRYLLRSLPRDSPNREPHLLQALLIHTIITRQVSPLSFLNTLCSILYSYCTFLLEFCETLSTHFSHLTFLDQIDLLGAHRTPLHLAHRSHSLRFIANSAVQVPMQNCSQTRHLSLVNLQT